MPQNRSLRSSRSLFCLLFALMLSAFMVSVQAQELEWQVQEGPLMTRWAADVDPAAPHPDYPRPQLKREGWLNLNGLWEYALSPSKDAPESYDGLILVPFPIESALSGVMQRVESHYLWYRRSVNLPSDWQGQRVLLHFGAVDWEATVWVNGQEVGRHRGGYDPFSFDITSALYNGEQEVQEVVVRVWDPSDHGPQPHGKQAVEPFGIWYTPTTGIWQTVWLEPVPPVHIERLRLVPDLDANTLAITLTSEGAGASHTVRAMAFDGDTQVGEVSGGADHRLELLLQDPKLWSPDHPFLYDLKVELLEDGTPVDTVTSYFGMREISLGTDEDGVVRLMLNGESLFHYGTLDQGFWPDGLYTAPTDEALRYDLEVTKALGFNTVRKHVKVEPARWYYWADRLGLLVWQDMPNGDAHVPYGAGEIARSEASAAQFELELGRMVDAFYNHPSIVMWVIFNEGWGQYDTARLTDWLTGYDPTRLVNSASGWNDLGTGHVHDIHSYPGPAAPPRSSSRASVLGEFGGLGLPLSGHTWQDEANWGYVSYEDADALADAYLELLRELRRLQGEAGLAAAIYTQTTDVEIEVNGLMTYDREIIKMDAARVLEANLALYRPPPRLQALLPTSELEGQTWRYTLEAPEGDWTALDFDDRDWQEGLGGFGTEGTLGAIIRTEWRGSNIWLRKSFDLEVDIEALEELQLRVHHNDDVDIYLNGHFIVTLPYYTFDYVSVLRDERIRAALRPGENVLALHGKRSWGGQYMDAGLYAYINATDHD